MCLSLFYLTIKLYLWDLSGQFSAAEGHFECVFKKKDFYQLSPGLSDSQDPCWKPVNPHISLCSHTGQYIARLSLLQPFSFTRRSHRCDCSTMAWRKRLIESSRRSAQWYLNTLQPCRKRRQCREGEYWELKIKDLWMNDWTDWDRDCHKSFMSSHPRTVAVICCTCFVEWGETKPPLFSNRPSRWFFFCPKVCNWRPPPPTPPPPPPKKFLL